MYHDVPAVCQLYHGVPTCAAVVPVVFLAGNVPRGEARELLLLAQHTRLSPQKSTQLEKPKTTANNSRDKTTKHTHHLEIYKRGRKTNEQ